MRVHASETCCVYFMIFHIKIILPNPPFCDRDFLAGAMERAGDYFLQTKYSRFECLFGLFSLASIIVTLLKRFRAALILEIGKDTSLIFSSYISKEFFFLCSKTFIFQFAIPRPTS